MDKAQEAIRHAASRPIKEIASNGGGDVIDISHRSKIDKARGSRLIAQLNSSPESSEMGGGNKRYKLHSKSFKNCNGVHHGVVPRKLRSAVDKHNHNFPSPSLTKKHHLTSNGIEQHQNNNAKKSKKIAAILDSITKDEEEVVETLFALARMSPNKKTTRSGLDERIPAEMCSPSMVNNQNPLLSSEALEEEIVKSQHSCPTIEPINVSSNFEGTAGEAVKDNSFTGPTALCRPTILVNNEFDLCLGSSSALSNCERSSLRCRSEHTDNPTLSNAASSSQFARHEASVCKQNPDGGLVPVTATLRRQEKQQPIKDGESCLAYAEGFWPSLPIVWSCGSEIHGHSSRSSLTKSPAFLTSTTTATRTGSVATLLFEEQPQQVKVDRGNSWKRCAAHVYISQLIKSYQATEKKSRWPIPSNQVNPNKRTMLIATTTNGSTGQTQSVNGVISMGSTSYLNAAASMAGTNGSAIPKHSNEMANGNIPEKMIQPEQQLFSTPSMMYTKEKQNCNSLSLLAGGVIRPVAANSDSDNQRGTEFESLSQIHVPYLQSIFQHNQLMPFALPHSQYPSSQQVQLAQYFGNPSYIPQVLSHASSVPQQQQQMRTAQYRPGPGAIGMSWNHSPKWQSGGLDSTSLLPCTQPSLSSSSPSEVFGAKFSPAMEQQQILAFSSSSSKGKTMRYPLPGSCDGSGIRFYPEVLPHWQLLSNGERL